MSVSINPPKTPVTKGSNGIATATIPNVCKMPGPPAPFVPAPLPNIGKSGDSPKDYSKKVKIEGKNVAIRGATFKSMGDIASKGTGGGLVSANTHGPTKFVGPGSLDVKIEGKNVQLLGDPMLNNCGPSGSPPNSATLVGVLQPTGLAALFGDEDCQLCGQKHGPAGKLEESKDTQGDADALGAAAEAAVAKAKAARPARLRQLQDQLDAQAKKDYDDAIKALESKIAKGEGRAPVDIVNQWKQAKDELEVKKPVASLPEASMSTMLGVVRCKHGKTYAGKSMGQLKELEQSMSPAWHSTVAYESILDPGSGGLADNFASFAAHISPANQAKFKSAWEGTKVKRRDFNRGIEPEPHYPPGQCAAQQVVLLAMDHACRPVGLTERSFKSGGSAAKVSVMFRSSPSAAPQLGEFSGKDAVPPCGTCQVILTMMMCPNEHPPNCNPKTPKSKVCKCNP